MKAMKSNEKMQNVLDFSDTVMYNNSKRYEIPAKI